MSLTGVLLFLVLTAAVAQNSGKPHSRLSEITSECRNRTGVSLELIEKARNGTFVDDEKLKQEFLCVGKKFNLADESGNINVDLLRERVLKANKTATETDEIIKKCVVKRERALDAFFELCKCIHFNVGSFTPGD